MMQIFELRRPMWVRRIGFLLAHVGYWISGYQWGYEPYWEGLCDAMDIKEPNLKHIQKLERRIHNQRVQLRWWESLFRVHVHSAIKHGLLDKRAAIRKSVLTIEKASNSGNSDT